MVTSFLNRFAPIDFTRYIDRLTDRFTGREWLFENHIEPWLENGSNEQFYLLTGEPGVGKSAIVAELIKRWQTQPGKEEQGKLAAYHFCRAGDVETVRPGRVLRSIAAQLGKTLPHYGKALNKVLEQVHLNIDVKINIDTLSNSQVTGIYIENLKDLDPREELRLLIQAPLAELPEIYQDLPEEELAKLPALPTLKVFLIDSLDEAVTTTGRDNVATLLAALSQANDLPPWIRFILTARPGILKASPGSDTALQFQSLKHYELEKLLAENLTDIEQYVTRRVRETLDQPEAKFQARLEQAQLSAEALVQEVRDLSKGNFLYTRLVMDGIGTGELSLKNLSALPKNLYEVYQRFLRHRCSVRKWINLYQPLLGTLTVTQEAISSAQLAKFAKVASDQVEGVTQVESAIAILQQFLDEVENDEGQKIYTIFHQSLREYLLDRKHNHDFWCDAKEQHDGIIDCFEKESEGWEDLRAIDLYGLRHLAQHLVKGDRVEELHQLLNREKDGRNAWFDAKDWSEDIAGFITDVKIAWDHADEKFEEISSGMIERQCLYGLMIASVNSLADKIPTELLIALLNKQIWTAQKVFGYIRQIPNPQQRIKTTIALVQHLPHTVQKPALQEAIQTALTISGGSKEDAAFDLFGESESEDDSNDDQLRADALSNIAEVLPADLLLQALQATLGIQRPEYRSSIISLLVKRNPSPEILPQLLQAAMDIVDEYERADALVDLACHLPEVLPQALEATLKIDIERNPNEALLKLVNQFPDIFPRALQSALIFFTTHSASKLIDLAKSVPETYLAEAVEASQDIEHEFARAQFLKSLIEKLPEALLSSFIQFAKTIQNRFYCIQILSELADKFPEPTLKVLLQNPSWWGSCGSVLDILVEKLPVELLSEITQIALEITNESQRIKNLASLTEKIPEKLPSSISRLVYDFQAACVQSQLNKLNTLVEEFSESSANQLLQAALEEEHVYLQAEKICSLVQRMPKIMFPKVLDELQNLQDEAWYGDYRAKVLEALVEKLPENLLNKTLEIAQTIQSIHRRLNVLLALTDRFPEVISTIFETIQMEGDHHSSIHSLLVNLTNKISANQVSQILEFNRDIAEIWRVDVWTALALRFPESLSKVLEQMDETGDKSFGGSKFLIPTAEKVSTKYLPQLLQVVENLPFDSIRAQTLKTLAIRFPEVLPQAIQAAPSIQDMNHPGLFDQTLHLLVDLLSEELLFKTFQAALDIPKEAHRADVLIAIADKFPKVIPLIFQVLESFMFEGTRILQSVAKKVPVESLPQALEITCTIQGRDTRSQFIGDLAEKLSKELLPKALQTAQTIQDSYYYTSALSAFLNQCSAEDVLQVLEGIDYDTSEVEKLFASENLPLNELSDYILLMGDLGGSLTEAIRAKLIVQAHRTDALIVLAKKTPELLPQALHAAKEISSKKARFAALVSLTEVFQEVIPEAIEAIDNLIDIDRDTAWENLIESVPQVIPSILQAVEEEKDNQYISVENTSIELLIPVAKRLPENLLPRFLKLLEKLDYEPFQTQTLSALATRFPEVRPQAIKRALSIDEQYRADALVALIEQCPEILSQTIQTVEETENEELRETLVKKLRKVFPRAFQVLLKESISSPVASFASWLEDLPEFYRAKALCVLANQLPSELLSPALQATLAIQQHERERIDALIALADKLPEASHYAFQFIQRENYEEFRTKALIALAKKSPSVFPLALQAALALTIRANSVEATLAGYERYDRVDALRDLAEKFPEVLPQALQSAQEIKDRRKRFEAFLALATMHPEVLPKALDAAQAIQNRSWHVQSLESLAPYLSGAKLSTSKSVHLWKQMLHTSCLGTRQELLQDIAALAPVISSLGDSTVATRVIGTIQRVCRWWL
jgi:Cdc6-like AAA superfamily ATPase